MTLQDHMRLLGWGPTELAKRADIAYNTAKKAHDGKPVSFKTAQDIAIAISYASGERVLPGQIQGLVIEQ